MSQVAIQNVKILHKRYTSEEWASGIKEGVNTGIIPKLAQGEIGLDLTTGAVRIGTTNDQSFSDARVIGADLIIEYKKKNSSNTGWETTTEQPAGTIVVNVEEEATTDDKHKIIIYYDKISTGNISDFPDFKVNTTDTTTESGEIKVVTSAIEDSSNEHQLNIVYGKAVTKDYVDGRALTITDTGSGTFITDIVESSSEGNHTITVSRANAPTLSLEGNDGAGDYISNIDVSNHKITVTKGNLPVGTGSKQAGDLEFIDSVSLNGHTLTATSKGIEGDGNVVSIEKDTTNGKIKITANTYNKNEIDSMHENLAKAMKFAGTLGNGEGAVSSLPSNASQGDVYKVVTAGTYGSQSAKVGDLFIYDGSKWRYVPSGDETFTDTWRAIKVNGTQVKDNSIGNGDINFAAGDGVTVTHSSGTITVAHSNTSTVEDLIAQNRQYITGLDFDEYGHVIGYDVGTESYQNATGGATAGDLQVISKAEISTDTDGNHTLTTATKSFSGDGNYIDITDSNNTITIAHKDVTRSDDSTSTGAPTFGGTFDVIDSVTSDTKGHITQVNKKTVTLPTYNVSATKQTTGKVADIKLNEGTTEKDKVSLEASTGLDISVEGDKITLSGVIAKNILGMIKAHLVTTDETNATSSIAGIDKSITNRNYQVNVKNDGTAFVQVPWANTTYSANNGITQSGTVFSHTTANSADAGKNVDLYAFGTDAYGHVTGLASVTTIDGNY